MNMWKSVLVIACVVACVAALEDKEALLNDDLIKEVNGKAAGWTAHRSPHFEGWTIGDARRMLVSKVANNTLGMHFYEDVAESLPTEYDFRTAVPKCVQPVLNQGKCGSCWAFGCAQSLAQRFCVASKGEINVPLSPQSLVSCDKVGNSGCNGGMPALAWDYTEWVGLLPLDCYPYGSGDGGSVACSHKCTNGASDGKLYKSKKFSRKAFHSVAAMQTAIMTDGPVETAFTVYQDFMSYKGGVYKHTTGSYLGGHAVEVVGWGTENGQDYWLVKNSWSTDWGLQGFFKIARGDNDPSGTGIDHAGTAALPAL